MSSKSQKIHTLIPQGVELQSRAKQLDRNPPRWKEPATGRGQSELGPRLVRYNGRAKKDCPLFCSAGLRRFGELVPQLMNAPWQVFPSSILGPMYLCCRRRGA